MKEEETITLTKDEALAIAEWLPLCSHCSKKCKYTSYKADFNEKCKLAMIAKKLWDFGWGDTLDRAYAALAKKK